MDVLRAGVATHFVASSDLSKLTEVLSEAKDESMIAAVLDFYSKSESSLEVAEAQSASLLAESSREIDFVFGNKSDFGKDMGLAGVFDRLSVVAAAEEGAGLPGWASAANKAVLR